MARTYGLKRWHWLFFLIVFVPAGILSAANLGNLLGYLLMAYITIWVASKIAQTIDGVIRD